MVSNKEELKIHFNEMMTKYFEKCIPLTSSPKEIFFLSPSNGQPNGHLVMGFDIKHSSFFEPNSSARFHLINSFISDSFNEKNKSSFETIYQHQFSELIELKVKVGAQTKYQGLIAFYSTDKNIIYLWNHFLNKWDTQDALLNRQYFSNCEIIPTEKETTLHNRNERSKPKIEYYENLEELGVEQDDLRKIVTAKFRDGSTHYFCKKINSVVSYQFVDKYWFVPDKQMQALILSTEPEENVTA
jgi:hypothetical protein